MRHNTSAIVLCLLAVCFISTPVRAAMPTTTRPTTQRLPREQWGAPLVEVSHRGKIWQIKGKKQRVTFNAGDFWTQVQAGGVTWQMRPSSPRDMLIKVGEEEYPVSLNNPGRIEVTPYDTGYKTGIKIVLTGFEHADSLRLFLTLALEGKDEDLCFDVAAEENGATVPFQHSGIRSLEFT